MKRILLPVGVAGLVAASLAVPAHAGPKVGQSAKMATPAAAADTLEFWTADGGKNLKAAAPYGLEHARVPKHVSTGGPAADGKPGVVPAIGDEAKPTTTTKNVNLPKSAGRVFFTVGDSLYSCSASSIQSAYKNLVATAGHCAYDLEGNASVVGHWVFIPGYYQGKAPWGVYVGKTAYTHYDFSVYEDIDRDFAFVTVYNGITWSEGKWKDVGRLGDNVGGLGFAYNQKVGQNVFVFGYPTAAHPDGDYTYTGSTMKWCYGKPIYPVAEKSVKAEEHQAIRCSMTGGSSGGPWIIKYSSTARKGYLNGVSSLGGDTDGNNRSDLITSPYFDGETYAVYKAAAPLWSGSIVKKDGTLGLTEVK
ncbi:trypsin-like serine peptidase [Herbidospora cretacea]|uniref:trypsin-like serine peptidase n=1 Tax=Herbidospora cretacea TaxID=28444 RepID=UPI0004C3754C|nr:trypsin-like serine protease [Herbidospora cretacea]